MEGMKTFFLEKLDVGDNRLLGIVGEALVGAEDGELYLEAEEAESLVWKDGRVESSSFSDDQGFGLRRVIGEYEGYAHGNTFDPRVIEESARILRSVDAGKDVLSTGPKKASKALYTHKSPLGVSPEERIRFLREVDEYIRNSDARVREVTVGLSGGASRVLVVRADGLIIPDFRPLVRIRINVLLEDRGRIEKGYFSFGGREAYTRLFEEHEWKHAADEALREARACLEAKECPAGEMPIVLSSGWPGIILHEAIGHGLEGDFIYRKASVFTELLGKRVAVPEVTVVDDGTILNRRGSLTVDDEGTPTERTVLIENGVIANFMQNRLSARLLGAKPTGNGRRESYAYRPMVRMTNTYMEPGPHTSDDIIRATSRGLYFESLSRGQVDITNGKFVFVADVAYRIENGKITHPVKGATLIGTGYKVLTHVDMVGNNTALDSGVGTCGKDGQSVPVGVGQPTIRVSGGVIVGGTG